jgi:hypothetical protein
MLVPLLLLLLVVVVVVVVIFGHGSCEVRDLLGLFEHYQGQSPGYCCWM